MWSSPRRTLTLLRARHLGSAGCPGFRCVVSRSNLGTNLFLLSTARGSGIAVNSKTKQETFMKMISAGAGLGVGVKDYRVVFVFETEPALSNFLDSGWSGSGQADAAAKTSKSGAALGSGHGRAGRVSVPDYQERSRASIDPAGYEVLQGRRPQQTLGPSVI
jgi:hypothetical protein